MSISFKCPKCRKPFKVGDKLAGRQGKCPDCGSQFKIPAGRAPVTQEMPAMPAMPNTPSRFSIPAPIPVETAKVISRAIAANGACSPSCSVAFSC